MAGVTLGNVYGTMLLNVQFAPASVAAATTVERTLTVPGVRVGDAVSVSCNAAQTAGIGTLGQARVTAADTVAVGFSNVTAGSLVPTAGTYQVLVIRQDSGTRTGVAF